MDGQRYAKYRTPLLIVAGLLAVWGVLSLFDVSQMPYAGYQTDGNNTITQVASGSPAEAAGLQVGDYLQSVAGIPMEDTATRIRQPRARIGETRAYEIERDGETLTLALTYAELSGASKTSSYGGVLIGFCFLIFGLLPFLRVPNLRTFLLAMAGVCFSLSFFGGPNLTVYVWRMVVLGIVLTTTPIAFATLLHYMLVFPRRKALLAKSFMPWLIYGPAFLVLLFFWYRGLLQPPATSTLNVVSGMLIGLFILSYFGLSMGALVHSYVKATPEERARYGLRIVVFGALAGFLPILFIIGARLVAPQATIPGSSFFFLSLGLIPIFLALGAAKREQVDVSEEAASMVTGQPQPRIA